MEFSFFWRWPHSSGTVRNLLLGWDDALHCLPTTQLLIAYTHNSHCLTHTLTHSLHVVPSQVSDWVCEVGAIRLPWTIMGESEVLNTYNRHWNLAIAHSDTVSREQTKKTPTAVTYFVFSHVQCTVLLFIVHKANFPSISHYRYSTRGKVTDSFPPLDLLLPSAPPIYCAKMVHLHWP